MTKHIGFTALKNKVAREYMKKGYSRRKAEKIGTETAGKMRGYIDRKKKGG